MTTIEEGTYLARCTGVNDVRFGMASSGSEQIAIPFRIIDGPHKGQRLTYFGSFNGEKAIDFTLKALRACGWQGDDLDNLVGVDEQDVELVCAYETDEAGKERFKVKWVNRVSVAFKKPLEANDRKAFAARMKGIVLAHKQTTPPVQRPAGAAASNGRAAPRGDAWDGQGADPADIPDF